MNTEEIRKMSTVESIETMEAIWSSLIYEETEIESPQWHGQVLADRKSDIESGKAKFISLEALKAARKS